MLYFQADPAQQGNVEYPLKCTEKCPELTMCLLRLFSAQHIRLSMEWLGLKNKYSLLI